LKTEFVVRYVEVVASVSSPMMSFVEIASTSSPVMSFVEIDSVSLSVMSFVDFAFENSPLH
jgi:hypothetical protein